MLMEKSKGKGKRAGAICGALFLLLLAAACNGEKAPEQTTDTNAVTSEALTQETAETTADSVTIEETEETTQEETTEEETVAERAYMPVIENGSTVYGLSVSEEVKEKNSEALSRFSDLMDQLYGTHFEERQSEKTIFLSYAGDPYDYAIRVDPDSGNISLTAGSPDSMQRAIRTFVSAYCGSSLGNLVIDVTAGNRLDIIYDYDKDKIDNSAFLSYRGGKATTLSASDSKGELMTPDWVDTLIMVELRIDTASIGGGFRDSYDLLDFYAATGVNGIWLAPIYQRGPGGNGYGNCGLHTVEPALTGTDDMEEGWKVVRDFVDYAHQKGIYIFFDIVSWGAMRGSALFQTEHPEWFNGEAWGNPAFDWKNEAFREWYISNAVANIEKTGADGYRCDCEPFTAGYEVFSEIRKRLSDRGIHIMLMSEDGSLRKGVFDMEQDGVLDYTKMTRGQLYQNPVNFYVDGYLKLVDSVKVGYGLGPQSQQGSTKRPRSGRFRYYTNCITNHDYQSRNVCKNRLKIGYSAIYAPFIPIWYMGDEFGVEKENAVLYDVPVDYALATDSYENAMFYEDVKQMIAIRRTYPELFEEYPMDHRDSNICEVSVEGLANLQNYARYKGNKAILVVANNEEEASGACRITVPFEEAQLSAYRIFKITDLLTGRVIFEGYREDLTSFSAVIPYQYMGVYLVEGR